MRPASLDGWGHACRNLAPFSAPPWASISPERGPPGLRWGPGGQSWRLFSGLPAAPGRSATRFQDTCGALRSSQPAQSGWSAVPPHTSRLSPKHVFSLGGLLGLAKAQVTARFLGDPNAGLVGEGSGWPGSRAGSAAWYAVMSRAIACVPSARRSCRPNLASAEGNVAGHFLLGLEFGKPSASSVGSGCLSAPDEPTLRTVPLPSPVGAPRDGRSREKAP